MPARNPIDGEPPYSIEDIRRDVRLIADEVDPDFKADTLALLALAEMLERDHSGFTLTGDPAPITYDLNRHGNEVDIVAYFNLTGDYEVMVLLDNAYGQVSTALATTFDVESLWLNSRITGLLEADAEIDVESTRQVAAFDWDESLDMRASLEHAVEQAEHLVLKSLIASLAVQRERVN